MATSRARRSPAVRALPEVSIARAGSRAAAPTRRELREWAAATLGSRAAGREISVLIVNAARSRELNRRYRGQDKPTNVLSFPVPARAATAGSDGSVLGDLVICPTVLRQEARAQRKAPRSHWMHLYVHGLLHLIGYDHEREDQAQRMERREIRVLRSLGVANPYRSN
jgi:probable rRNA maturation factor